MLAEHGPVGVVVPVDDMTDHLVAGSGRDLILITWNSDENDSNPPIEVLCPVDTTHTETRINDGKVDSSGRFWLGRSKPSASLDLSVKRM